MDEWYLDDQPRTGSDFDSFMVNAANTHISASQDQGTTVIVLGAKINADQPSLILERRLQAAADLC